MENTSEIRLVEEEIKKIKLEIKNIEYDITSKKQEKELLYKKIESLSETNNQILKIEMYLSNKYRKNLGLYKIDRSKESEIEELITAKEQKLKNTLDIYKESFVKAYRRDIQSEMKRINKETTSELKKLFLELDVDLNRFYKTGISKVYFIKILDVMNSIKKGIEKCADFPVSYSNKLYKFEIILKDIPDDLEYLDRIQETKAKEKLKKEQNILIDKVDSLKKQISSLRRNKTKMLSDLKTVIDTIEQYSDANKIIERIESRLNLMKADYLVRLENDKNILHFEHKKRLETINYDYQKNKNLLNKEQETEKNNKLQNLRNEKNVLNSEILALENNIKNYLQKIDEESKNKKQLESDYYSTSSLFFMKKKAIKAEIERMETEIANHQNEKEKLDHLIENKKGDLLSLNEESLIKNIENEYNLKNKHLEDDKSNLEKEEKSLLDVRIKELEAKKEDDFRIYETESKNKIDNIEFEKKKILIDKKTLEDQIKNLEEKIEVLKSSYKEENNSKNQIDTELANFHSAYIIKKYGKECGINSEIKDTKAKISEIEKDINNKSKILSISESKLDELNKKMLEIKADIARDSEIKAAEEEKRKVWLIEENRRKEDEQNLLEIESRNNNLKDRLHLLVKNLDIQKIKNKNCPLLDAGRTEITSNIVVRRLVQTKDTTNNEKYIVFFINENNDIMSDFRLIDRQDEGYENKISFELSLNSNQYKGDAHILVVSYDNLEIIGLLNYRVSISFFDDFM